MKKRIFTAFVAVMMLFSTVVSAQTDINLIINGEEFTCDSPPYVDLESERLMVPMRDIFEQLGAIIFWDEEMRTVAAIKNDFNLLLQVGNATLFVNDDTVELDSPAVIVKDRVMVPVRALTEAFGIDVEWDGTAREVTVNF